MPYFTITPTFSICPKHGYLSGEHRYCPLCDKEIGYTADSAGEEVLDREEVNVIKVKPVVSEAEMKDVERDIIESIA